MRQPSPRHTARRGLALSGAAALALTLTPAVAGADTAPELPAALVSALQESAAPHVDTSKGYAGHCLDDLGVTVVIDFQDLGPWGGQDGADIVRCATSGTPGVPFSGTGLNALQSAGIGVEGTQRWGLSFICRLEGRPAANEPLPVNGMPGYQEPCVNTPPIAAHWSYWHSAGTTWTYSSQGASGRTAPPGTYEGFSFALNPGSTNPPPSIAPGAPATQRIAGANRYDTAGQIAARYPSGVETVYVATGLNYPDALAGAALAGSEEAPVLLTGGGLPSATRAALTHLEPESIVVLGGTGSVSGDVMTELGAYTEGTVTRVSGTNRYETAAEISKAYGSGVDTVYVATGADYPDALSVSALAATQGAPILLTSPGNLPSATRGALARLAPESIVVVGGEGAVSSTVLDQLKEYVDGPADVARLAGANRYDTSRLVAQRFPAGVDVSFVATGVEFPDALAGAALAGRFSGPVVLTRPDLLPSAAQTALTHLAPERIVALGGTGAVSEDVYAALAGFAVSP